MFSDYSKDLLRSGIIELKAGNRELARRYLDRAVYMSSDREVIAEAWFWMSEASDDSVAKRAALENCLVNDPLHTRARRALAIVDGHLRPDEIVDPDRLPVRQDETSAGTKRFVCSKCGGRMVFAPDGQSLICEYCARHQSLALESTRAGEQDFIVAMATMRGHSQPLRELVFHCQGCGAEFILPPGSLSFTCAYCDSPHVVNAEPSPHLVAPDGIIPHAFDRQRATELLAGWIAARKTTPDAPVGPPRGLYLPAWSFVLGGEISYTGERMIDQGDMYGLRQPQKVLIRDRYPVMLTMPVAASRRPSAAFVRLLAEFDPRTVKPYDARYLAAWPAELYDVPMAEASLEARSQAYAQLKRDMPVLLAPIQLRSTSSANLTIESFRLDLLPVWMTEASFEGRIRIVLISGQNEAVAGDGPEHVDRSDGGLTAWLGDLLGS
jgi:DNA-directed RNA polymerase subunit RPC12/RpoP